MSAVAPAVILSIRLLRCACVYAVLCRVPDGSCALPLCLQLPVQAQSNGAADELGEVRGRAGEVDCGGTDTGSVRIVVSAGYPPPLLALTTVAWCWRVHRLLVARSKLYELLINCIPPEVIIKSLTEELLPKLDNPLQHELSYWAAHYQHRLQSGQKDIFHLEAFVAKFMAVYKKWLVETFGG